jgi:hypothetical protein
VNKGEYGKVIFVNTGVDLTGAINFKLKLKGECKDLSLVASDGVAIGTVNQVISPEETFLANYYFYYTTKPGDISVGGRWSACVEYEKDGKKFVSDVSFFYVGEGCC